MKKWARPNEVLCMATCGPDMEDLRGQKWKRRDWNVAYSIGPNQHGLPFLNGLAHGCGDPTLVEGWSYAEDALVLALAVRRDEITKLPEGVSRFSFKEGYCEFPQCRTVRVGKPKDIAAYIAKWYKGPINYLHTETKLPNDLAISGFKGVSVSESGPAVAGRLGQAKSGGDFVKVGRDGLAILSPSVQPSRVYRAILLEEGAAFRTSEPERTLVALISRGNEMASYSALDLSPDELYCVNSAGQMVKLPDSDGRRKWRLLT